MYPFLWWSNWGIYTKHGRGRRPHVPQTASNFSSDALARCPQPLPSTHTFFFFFPSTLFGLTGPRHTRGLRDPSFSPHVGGICSRKSSKCEYVLPPRDHHLPQLDRNHTPRYHLWQPQKQVQTHLHVTVQQPEQPKGRTTGSCE